MFCYEKPQFEKKRLLRIEMLEQLRDYPRDYLEILYSAYSDGILCGCDVRWDKNGVTVAPGILRYKKRLYFMKDAVCLDCDAEDRVRYLKVQFLALVQEKEKIYGNTRIYLDEKEPDLACELELCRFRLQEGARLRDTYENFADCMTEFDTLHLIDVLWASPQEATLHPKLLKQFAAELLEKRERDSLDAAFALNILMNEGIVPADTLRMYIEARLEQRIGTGNRALYYGLKKILELSGNGFAGQQRQGGSRRQVMLL